MSLRDAFWHGFHATINKIGPAKLRSLTGIKQGRFHKLVHNQTDNPQLDAVSEIVANFDKETFLEFARNMRPDLPLGIIDMEGKREVKVYDIRKLSKIFNNGVLETLNDTDKFVAATFSLPPIFSVRVPLEFFPSDFGVRVVGHGLEPTMPEGCAVGLSYLKSWEDFSAGEVYLCNLPYEGLVLRQVVVSQINGGLEFQQLHHDKNAFRSQIYHPDQAKDMIIARKSWVSIRG